MLFNNILLYLLSFFGIWFGSGLIISAVTKFSEKLRLSPFAFSFVFLGILTSIPEFSVGLQAVANHDAEIFIGNLLGGIILLFLFVIPLLAIFGKGINLKRELSNRTLLYCLIVIVAPAILILDRRMTNIEGAVLLVLYLLLLISVERNHGILDKDNSKILSLKAYSIADIFKVIGGIGIVIVASNLIVEKTIFFADILHISEFYISLVIVSFGTNLPELVLALRSVISKKEDVAMGDYIGSAAVNTFLFGLFTLLHNGEVLTADSFMITFIFIGIALILFYTFFRKRGYISQMNGLVLFALYCLFVVLGLLV